MNLEEVDVSQLTPAQTAQHVADMHVAIEAAQAEYTVAAEEVLKTKKAWDDAHGHWILHEECPVPSAREGVAKRNAWIRLRAQAEWDAHEKAKLARDVAQTTLSTLGKLMSGAQTLDGSVRAQMGATGRNPSWGS